MSDLIINGRIIDAPIAEILTNLRAELKNGKLRDIRETPGADNVLVTCPIHKDGMERHPSCNVYCGQSPDLEYGFFRCFTCGACGSLTRLVALAMETTDAEAEKWLLSNFGELISEKPLTLDPIVLKPPEKAKASDKALLDSYERWHPYMGVRKLRPEICERFKLRYDPATASLVFPVWDAAGRLALLTRRSVEGKSFMVEKDAQKPVYLLNEAQKAGTGECLVVESQINALTAWGYGIPSVALFGTGAKGQYEILNRCPIRRYVLCFDGDKAGSAGAFKFKKAIRKDVFVDEVRMPYGKDVNDLSRESFEALLERQSISMKRVDISAESPKN